MPSTSPELEALISKKKRADKALARTKKSLDSLSAYLASFNVDHLDVSKLQSAVDVYDTSAAQLDEKVTELEKEIKEIDEAMDEERKKLAGPSENSKLNLKASIGIFADSEGEIKIALIYGVSFFLMLPCSASNVLVQPCITRLGARDMIFGWTWKPRTSLYR